MRARFGHDQRILGVRLGLRMPTFRNPAVVVVDHLDRQPLGTHPTSQPHPVRSTGFHDDLRRATHPCSRALYLAQPSPSMRHAHWSRYLLPNCIHETHACDRLPTSTPTKISLNNLH